MITSSSQRLTVIATLVGTALGVVYTLSPLTALTLPMLAWMAHRAGRTLSARERRWFYGLLTLAIALRLAAIAALFLSHDDTRPFATFFGDEEMFKSRSVWLRNIGLGVPISAADFIYAVDETGKSQYLYALAFVEALVGEAPYGLHVFNMMLYVAGALLLYHLARRAYGAIAALGGLCVLLFLPSLFMWSISALKEPSYTFLAALELFCAIHVVRGSTWARRLASLAGVVGIAFLLEGLRKGGLLVAGLGTGVGLFTALISTRRWAWMTSLAVAPIVVVAALATPQVQDRVLSVLRDSALYHAGHVFTTGFSYQTLDVWYYINPADIRRMPIGDALTYVWRSVASFVVQPLPWTIQSRALLAYVPEYVLWLTMVMLLPIGLLAGVRRDAVLTCTLAAHGAVIVVMVALTSGNVGTLIRHRGLALPYFVWLSALGACEVMRYFSRQRLADSSRLAYASR